MLAATHKIFLDPLVTLLGQAQAAGELVIEDVEATARAIIRLVLAESMPMGEGASPAITPDQHAAYAAFLTKLITQGLAPR